MESRHVAVGDVTLGNGRPLAILAGPCALESRWHALDMLDALEERDHHRGRSVLPRPKRT